ncbi:transposase, partial [Pseudomonas aeruginosa]
MLKRNSAWLINRTNGLCWPNDLPHTFSTKSNLVESVFRAGDGSEKAF